MTTFTTVLNQVESLYVGYFGRAGDPAGEATQNVVRHLREGRSPREAAVSGAASVDARRLSTHCQR